MTVPVFVAAKRMCEHSGWSLTHLELQKLLYIAHMFHLGQADAPLISGHFEAWDYGPVHPSLYHIAKIFGSSPVGNVFHSIGDLGSGPEASTLDSTVDQLSNAPPGKLVAITHWEHGAWARHYVPGRRGIIIPNDDIRREYRDRVDAIRARQGRG